MTTAIENPATELFTLMTNVCDRCGAQFETGRRSRFCALCAGPQVTVTCPGCYCEHQVPISADHQLCRVCLAEPEMTIMSADERLRRAQEGEQNIYARLDADLAHAADDVLVRFWAAQTLKETGRYQGAEFDLEQRSLAWRQAIGRNDALSPLLKQYDDWKAAQITARAAQAAADAISDVFDTAALAQRRADAAVQAVEEALNQ